MNELLSERLRALEAKNTLLAVSWKKAEDECERLRLALYALKQGDCWCGVGIGDPRRDGEHSDACETVREALKP